MMKKALSLALSILLSISLLAGCGGTADSAAPAGASGTSAAASADAADNSAKPTGEGKVLTAMWNGTENDGVVPFYRSIVEEFNATNDLGVTVDMQFYENEQYKTKLATLMASNSVPDIFFTWELDYLRPFVEGGKVLDITEMFEADSELSAGFAESTLKPMTYDGKLYGLPTLSAYTVVYYNKQIFEENGVTVPETWDDFLAVCQTLKDNGVTPMSIPATDAWVPSQFVQEIANGLGGTGWYDSLMDGTGVWNNETLIEAATIAQDFVNAGYLQDGFLGMSFEEGRKLMGDGNCAMYHMITSEIAYFNSEESSISDVVGAFPLPSVNPENTPSPVGSVDSCIAIAANTSDPEAAFAFAKHWLKQDYQEAILYDIGRVPVVDIDVDTSRVSSLTADCLTIKDEIKGMTPWLDRAFGAGAGVEFNNACQAVFGGEDPQTAFDNLEQYVKDNADT